MDEGRIERALSRISGAIMRVENASAAALERAARAGPGDEALRQRVGTALAELDALIADVER